MERKVTINLKDGCYPIYIGYSNLDKIGELILNHLPKVSKVFVISNTTVDCLYGERVMNSLTLAGLNPAKGLIPDGEEYKSLSTASGLYDQLVAHGMERSSVVVSLGGGVVGDLAGFVAATYMRGIPFIQVPTSLLAQVDSSIGGKVAVNHPAGKNLIGAFYQPSFVLMDIETLKTLPEAELIAGMAEIIKHGMIADCDYFEWIEKNLQDILNLEIASLSQLIYGSSLIKGRVVEADEREENLRAILNFGHTVGHALESITHYSRYRHGEAVAIGMVQACRLAREMGMIGVKEVERLVNLLVRVGLPTQVPTDIQPIDIMKALKKDKKVFNNKVKMILPQAIGEVLITDMWDEELLFKILGEKS